MKKIMIVGIILSIVLVSIGLVTAGNGFGPGDGTGTCDKTCDGDGYGPCTGTCNGDGPGECTGTCKQNGECTGICDSQCTWEKNINQCMKGNNVKNSNSNGCCNRN